MPTVKKEVIKKPVKAKVSTSLRATAKQSSSEIIPTKIDSKFSIPVYTLAGVASGQMELPKEIFGQKVNKTLLAQAMRVYINSQKIMTGSTKTRGQVKGSTAKIWKQKGTGRARHGARKAPIFVGGGVAFGPKFRKVNLSLPKKMKKSALISAFSSKMSDKDIFGVSGADKATGKTKEMATFMTKALNSKTQTALIVTGAKMDNVVRAAKNLPNLEVLPVNLINAYEVFSHRKIFITKEAIEKLTKPAAVKGTK